VSGGREQCSDGLGYGYRQSIGYLKRNGAEMSKRHAEIHIARQFPDQDDSSVVSYAAHVV